MFTICFDFPEAPFPWFAAKLDGGLGLTTSLKDSLRFDTEHAAELVLENGYGRESAKYGVVVEVAS